MIHVIIPAYRGLEETRRCIESVLRAENNLDHRITIIDDCSPDPELADYLITLSQGGMVQLFRNEQNLGFVATVNRGMKLELDADVILLNSDTEVAGDWIDRLHRCVYSAPNIGTATPFSNNATICSYPKFCEDNALLEDWSVARLDALFSQANAGMRVEIPTAVGFCMYIKRSCLNAVGLFDTETFGKGYGEENDFCMRARRRGWRHTLCADTFVYHVGGVSFAETQNTHKKNALSILQRRYPYYEILVSWHRKKDPARPYRLMADFLRLRLGHRSVALFVTHRLVGGTDRHVRELASYLEQEVEVLTLRPYAWSVSVLDWLREGERFRLFFRMPQDYLFLLDFLKLAGVGQVHIHHLLGHHPRISDIPKDLNVPFDLTIHDYYLICPRISLTSTDNRYCREPDEQQCNTCLSVSPRVEATSIRDWREWNGKLLSSAKRVFVPSKDAEQRVRRYSANANIVVAPHLDIRPTMTLPRPQALPLAEDEKLRIVLLGGLSQIKGADVMEQCAILAARNSLPLQFHLIGHTYRDMKDVPEEVLTIHGQYEEIELRHLIAEARPHIIWFPAQWPETYSYTLSAALLQGVPVAATDIGAFRERLEQRPWSWICPWDWSAEQWNSFFVRVRQEHFSKGVSQEVADVIPKPDTLYSYKDYVLSLRHNTELTEKDMVALRHLVTVHCRSRFTPIERIILETRKIFNPVLRFAGKIFPGARWLQNAVSLRNRKKIKAWLSGRWPP